MSFYYPTKHEREEMHDAYADDFLASIERREQEVERELAPVLDQANVAPQNHCTCAVCGRAYIAGRWDDHSRCLKCRGAL